MNIKKIKFATHLLIAIILTLGLSISTQSLLANWTPPAGTAPQCSSSNPECNPPINTGDTNQIKTGNIVAGGLGSSGDFNVKGISFFEGDVGVGIDVPREQFDVSSATDAGMIIGTTASASNDAYLRVRGARTACPTCDVAYINFENNGTPGYDMARIAGGMGNNSNSTEGDLRFFTNPGSGLMESVRIDKDGNVGIGVNPPGAKLDILGQIKINDGNQGAGKVLTSDANGLATWEVISATGDITSVGVGATNICNSGDCDITTLDGSGSGLDADLLDSYQAALTSTVNTIAVRNGSGDINARLFRSEYDSTNSNIGYIMTQIDTASNNYIRPSTPAQLVTGLGLVAGGSRDIWVEKAGDSMTGALNMNYLDAEINHTHESSLFINSNDGIQLRINNGGGSGEFGINNSSNRRVLTVLNQGSIRIGDYGGIGLTDGNGRISLYSSSLDTTYLQSEAASRITLTTEGIKLYTAPAGTTGGSVSWSEKMRINNNGRVGIGTTNPGVKLEVNGTIQASSFLYPSDRNLKKDIENISEPLEKIKQLNGVSFKWRDGDEESIGVIAQDVEKVFPELVNTNENTGYKGVEYGNLVAPLIEAIKEQQKQIEDLQDRIEELER